MRTLRLPQGTRHPIRYSLDHGATWMRALPEIEEGSVLCDFGEKVSGYVSAIIHGSTPVVNYRYGTDLLQLDRYRTEQGRCWHGPPSYINAFPTGELRPLGSERYDIPHLAALRYLEIRVPQGGRLSSVVLRASTPDIEVLGDFRCSDADLEEVWRMGVRTVYLCMQPAAEAMIPTAGPYNTHMIWDGARRDREVWAGDLRPEALVTYYAFDGASIVKNSIHHLALGQQRGGLESGMIPGSGSTRQAFREWTLWWIVAAWEYYLHTEDREYFDLVSRWFVPGVYDWMKRTADAGGLIPSQNSWMYTVKVGAYTSSLASVQYAALGALRRIFAAAGNKELAAEASAWADATRDAIRARFWVEQEHLMAWGPKDLKGRVRFALDSNVWAAMMGLVEPAEARALLERVKQRFWTTRGSRNLWPPMDRSDGDWCNVFDWGSSEWIHNETVWPYPNSHEAAARLMYGDVTGAIDLMKRYTAKMRERGHSTIWEAVPLEGELPANEEGNLLSLAHGWGGFGSYALQAYLLGVTPVSPGFRQFAFQPQLGPLEWVSGRIPTPHGPIEVELEAGVGVPVRGRIRYPGQTQPVGVPDGCEVEVY